MDILSGPSNEAPCGNVRRALDAEHPRGRFSARLVRSADQEALGGPREGGSRTAVAVTTARIAGGSDTSACASGTGSDNALGKTAADADPEQYAQCDEVCLGEYGRGSAGLEPGSAVALRLAEQKSSNPGGGVADAYAASGASRCPVNVTSTTPTWKRDLIAQHCTASFW
jgi:hypothetical protein